MVRLGIFFLFGALMVGCIYDSRGLKGEGRTSGGGFGGLGGAGGAGGAAGTGGQAGGGGGTGGSGGSIVPGTRGTCETCASDADCADDDHRCVEMSYLAQPFPDAQTGFCLRIATLVSEDPLPVYDCVPPYVTVMAQGRSLSGGEVDDYCSIRQELTTCFAVRAHQGAWKCANRGDDACPTGGFCDWIRAGTWEELCTYACEDPTECGGPGGEACSQGYCGW